MSKKQLVFRFSGDQVKVLDQLRCRLEADTHAEALRRSINIAHAIAIAESEGYTIIMEKDGEDPQIFKIS